MKLILLTLFVLLVGIYAKGKYSHKKHSTHHKSKSSLKTHHKKNLPSTPSGRGLTNVFGTNPARNLYGPRNIVSVTGNMIKDSQGRWGYFAGDPNMESLIDTDRPEDGICSYADNSILKMCEAITECSLCGAVKECGWCETNGKCLPGTIAGCECSKACPKNWFYNRKDCPNKVTSRNYITNVAPDATKVVEPEISKPKINITTTTNSYEI
jgi:hypothetical protein